MKDRMQLLIEILLDKTARVDERDDAAMDLHTYKDIEALKALTQVASDPNEDDWFLDSCAESIGEICADMNYFDDHSFKKLRPFAQNIVFRIIIARNPELIPEPLRTELAKKFTH
jgi:hypothetical protein